VDCVGCVSPGVGLLRANLAWKPGAHQLADVLSDLTVPAPAFRDRFDGPWSAILWRWILPNGGASVADRSLVNSVADFRANVQDLVVADFEISSTVRMTDDLGSAFNWVGLSARTAGAADGGTESGYLAFLRSNGEVGLSCARSGLNRSVRSGRDPRAGAVRLALSGSGDRIAVSLDGVEFLVERDASFASGHVGVQNRARGTHADVVVKTSPVQTVPAHDPVGTFGPPASVRRR
jgi:hypothetical protein